ncbi:MAG: UvrD-helicase domain-containing protein, partial [Candidatus Omnitrophica bacterium]|nr:UvrD-helicase domain-containing protein [Candidatus Omnitrophota bacterium]
MMGANNDPNLLKFPQVLVVEASAGSGKTFALAKRYLKLLIDPRLGQGKIPLASILAITFTNKATFEMKERILELLKRIALDSFSSPKEKQDILELLGLSQEQAKTAARDIVEQIIRHYNFFQVQTIDSFINALLLGSALNIERSASFKIKRDYQSYLTYCLDLLIDQASSDKETLKLFEDFLDHYLFVENRKGWFPKEDILGLMHSLFTLSNKFGGLFKGYPGKSSDIIKAKKKVYSLIEELSSQLPEGMNANTRRGILKFLDKNQDIFDLAQLPQGFSKPGPLMNKGSDYSGDFSKIWQKV